MRGVQAEAGASLISASRTPAPDPAAAGASGSAPSGREARRVRRPALTALLLGIGLTVWVLDRVTKNWALGTLTPGIREPLLGEVLQLNLLFNPGAAFSLGTGITPVFAFVQFAVSLLVVLAAFRVGSTAWAVALGLVLGGASGNLFDRLTRPPGFARGHVVDFLELPNWPVFNVADSAICCAAVLVAITAFAGIGFDGTREGGDERSATDPAPRPDSGSSS